MLTALIALSLAQQAAPPTRNPDQPPGATLMAEPVAMMIAGFDGNGDALVTRAEMEAGIARGFAAVDTDRAGSIGYIGFSTWATRWLGNANALPSPFETDTDHDDRITLAELQAKIGGTFDRLDADHDGTLTRAELLTIRTGVEGFDRRRRRR